MPFFKVKATVEYVFWVEAKTEEKALRFAKDVGFMDECLDAFYSENFSS